MSFPHALGASHCYVASEACNGRRAYSPGLLFRPGSEALIGPRLIFPTESRTEMICFDFFILKSDIRQAKRRYFCTLVIYSIKGSRFPSFLPVRGWKVASGNRANLIGGAVFRLAFVLSIL